MKKALQNVGSLALPVLLCSLPLAVAARPPAGPAAVRPFRADGPVTGRVVDDKGLGLPGVNVIVKGTNQGVQTDAEGKFKLLAPRNATLVFSFVGSVSQEIVVDGRASYDVTLLADSKQLTDVVVVGYGTQRRADLTSAVASVKQENFVKGATVDAGQLLQGKVAGVAISAPSGDPTDNTQILLRGAATLTSTTQPLILVDGIPGTLNTVAPEDIESIDVLKDGSAAAIYGTRGTNGVILITTRRPKGNIEPSLEYSGYVSTQTIVRKPAVLTAGEYRQKLAEGVPFTDLGSDTDWVKAISRTPLIHTHNVTLRGGNAKTNYLVNGNYRSFEGIFQKSDNRTFTGRADINHSMFDGRVQLNVGLLNSNNRYTSTTDGGSFAGFNYRQAILRNPTAPITNPDGSWNENVNLYVYENPLARLYESDGENTAQNTRLNGSISWMPVDNLHLKAMAANTRYDQERGYSETKQHISTLRDTRNGYASLGSSQITDRLVELTADYNHSFGEHRLSALAGYSYQDNTTTDFYLQNWDFPTDKFTYNNIALGKALTAGQVPTTGIGSSRTAWNLIGFFGRLTYNYKEKYLLLASIRHEASSKFVGADRPWGTFPAVSVGWRINKENFLAAATFLDDLKLRAGYGVTGTAPDDLFLGVARQGYQDFFFSNDQWIRTLRPISNPNPSLRWEEKHEANVGLDYSLLKGRISGTLDLYQRRTNGLLYDYPVPAPPNLFRLTRANVGSMENKGIEVMVNVVPVQTSDFAWNSSFNFSTNRNRLVSLTNDLYKLTNDYFDAGYTGEPIQTFTHRVQVGQQLGNFYGFKVVDVSSDGKWIYQNAAGERVNNEDFTHAPGDKQVLGNGLPKYYAGWNNNFRYKNLDLSVTMRGAFGFQVLNFQRMYYENTGTTQYNRLRSAYDPVFGKAVLSTEMPLEFNSYYLENGSFWKVDNITLGYNIKPTNTKYWKGARVYVATLNTFTITGYKGLDPEVNRVGLDPGNDERDKYPTVRTYTLGVNFNF